MDLIPIYNDTQPVACTIGAAEIPGRIELVERMRANLGRIERTEHGLLLHFPASDDVEADLRTFAVDEKRCCAFWGFDVQRGDGELRLRWDAPPAADELVAQLLEYFRGDRPITEIAGLL